MMELKYFYFYCNFYFKINNIIISTYIKFQYNLRCLVILSKTSSEAGPTAAIVIVPYFI
jgi:hypothetical protein